MCNLYSITTNQAAIAALFRVINRYVGNLAPIRSATVTKRNLSPRSAKETVKAIARGKPGDFRRNRGDYRVHTTNAHGEPVTPSAGAPGTRLSLLTLQVRDSVGAKLRANRAARTRRLVCD
jgi:hypothetical protein